MGALAQKQLTRIDGGKMGVNFRKILNIGGGFRINLSKRGIGVSAGVPGLRLGLGPKGKRLQISIPGTGIYYRKDEGWQNREPGNENAPLSHVAQLVVVGVAFIALVALLLGLLL